MTAPLECADPILDTGAVGLARVAVEVAGGVVQLRVALLPEDALDREPALLAPRAWALTGGTRLHPQVRAGERVAADEILLTLDALGDFSVYTLTASAPAIDPFFAALRVRFRLGCEDPFDCRAPVAEPAGPRRSPSTSATSPRTMRASSRRCSTSCPPAGPRGPSAAKPTSGSRCSSCCARPPTR